MSSLKLAHGGMTVAEPTDSHGHTKSSNGSHHLNGKSHTNQHNNKVSHDRHRHENDKDSQNANERRNGGHHQQQQQQKFSDPTNGVPLSEFGNVVNPYTFEVLNESAQFILDRVRFRPRVAIICGSGLGSLADVLENKVEFPYGEIPHFPTSTVPGHAGKLVVGELAQVPIVCMQGRFHFYEGYPLWKCAMPVRVMKLMGIEVLIVTNAAGGLNSSYKVGDVMIIKDHINFPGFAGHHALTGPNDNRFGTRFPPMNNAYDKQLRILAKQVASELGMDDFIQEGVYTMLGGPNFETVAELRALRMLGVDAVGMSTIPEVITGLHCGMRCFAFSLITNEAITEYDVDEEASHEEVVETGNRRQEDLKKFITYLIPCIERQEIPRQQRQPSE